MNRYDARCNKRMCQARKVLPGVYDKNDRVPCHVPGCKGLMYEDTNRKTRARRTRDKSGGLGLCHCDSMQWAGMSGGPHRKGTKGCRHYDEMVLARSLAPSVHSPTKPFEPEGDPPF